MANIYSRLAWPKLPEQVTRAISAYSPFPEAATTAALALIGSLACYGLYRTLNQTRTKRRTLANEVILVTGGCGGIGKQIVDDLALKKAQVIILDVQVPNFDIPDRVHFYHVNITSSHAISEVAKTIRETHGEPTVLINNAGVFYHGTILETPEREIRQTFEVNMIAHFLLVKEFLPAMIRKNQGHVLTMASIASFVAVGEMVEYCCSKASALAFHEGLTQELKHFYDAPNVLTTIVHPLWVNTPMITGFTDHQSIFQQPIMNPSAVSTRVVEQILARKGGQIILPGTLSLASALRGLPTSFQEAARSFFSKIVYRVRDVRMAAR